MAGTLINRRDRSSLYTVELGEQRISCTFEIGDWLSFVSSGRATNNAEYETTIVEEDDHSFCSRSRISLASGELSVHDEEQCVDSTIERRLEATGAGAIGDLVARFVVEEASAFQAQIGGEVFEHRGRNRYLQFETDVVTLAGPEEITVTVTDTTLPNGMDLVCYARDEPDGGWAIHVRALSTDLDQGFLRLYGAPVRRSEWLDALTRRPWLSRRLLYLRERSSASRLWQYIPFAVPFQYVSAVGIADLDGVALDVQMEVSSG